MASVAQKVKLPFLAFLFAGMLLLVSSHVLATSRSKPATKGITLSPFQQQISIAPDDVSRNFELRYTNNTAGLQELNLSARDFGTLNDTGGILLEGNSNYTQKYGLSSWIKLGTDTVVLKTGETRSVPVTIENRATLAPGGHYGAVVASVNSLKDETGNRVVINQQLLSLILVNKVGGEHYDLRLKSISQNGNWLHLPNTIRLRFQNPGNVHVVPRGEVKLKSPAGKVLAKGIINSESAFVLPESFRELYVTLKPVGGNTLSLPGVYHVDVEYRYDGIDRIATRSYAAKYINLVLCLLLVIVALAAAWQINRYLRRKKRRT